MIVIPPASEHEEYFKGLAENVWENSLIEKADMCKELLSENKTLVTTCIIDDQVPKEITIHLHFRYFKSQLYCFIQED